MFVWAWSINRHPVETEKLTIYSVPVSPNRMSNVSCDVLWLSEAPRDKPSPGFYKPMACNIRSPSLALEQWAPKRKALVTPNRSLEASRLQK